MSDRALALGLSDVHLVMLGLHVSYSSRHVYIQYSTINLGYNDEKDERPHLGAGEVTFTGDSSTEMLVGFGEVWLASIARLTCPSPLNFFESC